MELTERKKKILQAVIQDYIRTAEPVGSKTLSTMYGMEYSPATIRNELADLEELGYLTHPHTSAGRVPSDKGYRWYVNNAMEWKEPSRVEKNIIEASLNHIGEYDSLLKHAAEVLSQITNLTSFALTPTKSEDVIKYINILPVDEQVAVLMIVSSSGKISNKAVKMSRPYTESQMVLVAKALTYYYRGMTVSQALRNNIITSLPDDDISLSGLAGDVMPVFMKTLREMLNVNLYMEGLANVFDIPEYNDLEKARDFIKLLSRKEEMQRSIMERTDGIAISIGEENDEFALKDCSVVTASYVIDGRPVGKIGVIGPTRMRYSEIISIIGYLTKNLNENLR